MNCSNFKENFESREELTGSMLAHSEICESCRLFADEELKLDGLLSELAEVEAPDTFATSVRSRIKEKASPLSGLWATARIAVPVGAMLLIVGLVVVNSDVFSPGGSADERVAKQDVDKPQDRNDRPEVSEETGNPPETDVALDREEQLEGVPSVEPESAVLQDSRETPDMAGLPPAEKKRGPSKRGGSIDSTDSASEEVEITNPPGLKPGEPVKTPPSLPTEEFTAIGILKTLGVRAAWKSGRLYVVSVSPGSVGFRSGLKQGDRVISLDGRPVSEGDTALGRVKGDTLTIRRAGRQILIKIGVQN